MSAAIQMIDELEDRNEAWVWVNCTYQIPVGAGWQELFTLVPIDRGLLPISAHSEFYDTVLNAVRRGLWESMKHSLREGHDFTDDHAIELLQAPINFYDTAGPLERLTAAQFVPTPLPSGGVAEMANLFIKQSPII